MSDMDSNTDSGATGANQSVSGEGAKPNSIDYSQIAAEVVSRLKPDIEKMVQSTKDRRIEGLAQKYDKVLETLKLSPEEANSIGLKRPEEPKTETVAQSLSGKEVVAGAIADEILKAAGLESNDPDVTAFNQRTYANDKDKITEAALLVARKQSNPAIPKAPPASGSVPARTVETVAKELSAMSKSPVGKEKEIKALKDELAQLDK
jgi:hypothetical protein